MKSKKTMFSWQGIDQQSQRIYGECEKIDINAVLEELKVKNIFPLKVQKKFQLWPRKKSIKSQAIIDFSCQLTTLIDAGIALAPALGIIARSHENLPLQNLVMDIKNSIEAGNSFSETLAKYPDYFDELYCNLIYMGEYSGTLSSMLQQINQHQEKILQLTSKIKKALLYPMTVVLTTVIITCMMMMFVVPQFQTMFQEFGTALPLYTQLIITIAAKLKAIWLYLCIIFIGLLAALRWLTKQPRYAFKIDSTILQLPILGKIIIKSIYARFARTLAITFNAGVPLADGLKIIANSFNNLLYTNAILTIHKQVTAGQGIAVAMQQTKLFPPRMTQTIAIAEESGSMALVLSNLAIYYEQEVDTAIENFLKLLEPLIVIILGALIGGLVIAMYLPIFRIGTAI